MCIRDRHTTLRPQSSGVARPGSGIGHRSLSRVKHQAASQIPAKYHVTGSSGAVLFPPEECTGSSDEAVFLSRCLDQMVSDTDCLGGSRQGIDSTGVRCLETVLSELVRQLQPLGAERAALLDRLREQLVGCLNHYVENETETEVALLRAQRKVLSVEERARVKARMYEQQLQDYHERLAKLDSAVMSVHGIKATSTTFYRQYASAVDNADSAVAALDALLDDEGDEPSFIQRSEADSVHQGGMVRPDSCDSEATSWAKEGQLTGTESKVFEIEIGPNDSFLQVKLSQTSAHIANRYLPGTQREAGASGFIQGSLRGDTLRGHTLSTQAMTGEDTAFVNRIELRPGTYQLHLHGKGAREAAKGFKLHVLIGKGVLTLHNGMRVRSSFAVCEEDPNGTAIRSRCHAYRLNIDPEQDMACVHVSVQSGRAKAHLLSPKASAPAIVCQSSIGQDVTLRKSRPDLESGAYTLVVDATESFDSCEYSVYYRVQVTGFAKIEAKATALEREVTAANDSLYDRAQMEAQVRARMVEAEERWIERSLPVKPPTATTSCQTEWTEEIEQPVRVGKKVELEQRRSSQVGREESFMTQLQTFHRIAELYGDKIVACLLYTSPSPRDS
eukprot:TRINITY_DN20781_c0_g1_i6.p1 TRINITY_DN20781_c0_g1~~TRINITY_DN20781_c0_g1_i6.p1  ORF type:complete len:616 (+),score=153.87 TRINITY_DN20781_c0_g1_i6:133-1980(+)